MGKKSRRQNGQTAALHHTISNKAIVKVVDDIWSKTHTALPPSTLAAQLQEYDTITELLDFLTDKQGPPPSRKPRREGIVAFDRWLDQNGAEHSKVELTEFPGIGYGLKAKVRLEPAEKVMVIPEKLMISTQTAIETDLNELFAKDFALKQLPNVVLALHLITEAYNPESFWKPYIDVLPSSFTTPLYFTKDDLLLLQSSPVLADALAQKRSIIKMYAHLHRLIREHSLPSILCSNGFYYTDFIWAVSCVMSRQNQVPSHDGDSSLLALIPLWDMSNHSSGQITTDFDTDHHECVCYAGDRVAVGDQFTIFYGPRTNLDFLLHQGFVYPPNEHDALKIKLGLSSEEDGTKSIRTGLLKRVGLPVSGQYCILKSGIVPFSTELLMFVRVFTADLYQLHQYASVENDSQLKSELSSQLWVQSDSKVLDFLEKRCQLLLHSYKTTIEEDAELLSKGSLSQCGQEAIKQRMCEKQILSHAITSVLQAKKTDCMKTDCMETKNAAD